ncbi:CKLF-like MARVEL transmembrane domain-containing protein 7 [Hemicordylus capensis]|uniref:CKLF-like MARVEL transmembrane domain-containing protein 7 n=1 Tax=Hemicordylus capensis TaxID=884348 RepID=UPI00230486F6|nr:CKLF-like MARVEL transmembrane domain-containing protein 7 [Hemicordylus capensis]
MSHGVRVVRTDVSSGGASTSSPPPAFASTSSGLVDRGYARSCSAMLKLAQMISLLIGFLCIKYATWTSDYSAYTFFEIISMFDFIMILIFYIVYVFRIYRKLTCINWPLTEFLHYLIGTILLLIASIVVATKSHNLSGLVAGAVFGFIASVLCFLSIWLSYKVSCVTQSTDASV